MSETRSLPRTLVLVAMKEESGALVAALGRESGVRVEHRGHDHVFEAPGWRCTVRLAGPGEACMMEALATIDADRVLHVGFAGSLLAGWKRGRVVQVHRARRATEVLEIPDVDWPALRRSRLPHATIVSVPSPANALAKQKMVGHGAADIVDMETFAVAKRCAEANVPYVGIRVVADEVEDEIPPAVIEAFDGRRFRIGHILFEALLHPPLIRRLLELRRTAKIAADVLRDVVRPILTATD